MKKTIAIILCVLAIGTLVGCGHPIYPHPTPMPINLYWLIEKIANKAEENKDPELKEGIVDGKNIKHFEIEEEEPEVEEVFVPEESTRLTTAEKEELGRQAGASIERTWEDIKDFSRGVNEELGITDTLKEGYNTINEETGIGAAARRAFDTFTDWMESYGEETQE